MFLETEASFPYCNWSTKMAGIIWLGSTSVQHVNNWQRLSRLPFLSLSKSWKFLETKTYSFISIEKKIICKKNSKIFGANMVCISICHKLSSILLPFEENKDRYVINHGLLRHWQTVKTVVDCLEKDVDILDNCRLLQTIEEMFEVFRLMRWSVSHILKG